MFIIGVFKRVVVMAIVKVLFWIFILMVIDFFLVSFSFVKIVML